MIQTESYLTISDNSGGTLAQCIKVLKISKKNYAKIGDTIVVTIRRCNSESKVRKGEVKYALIIRTKIKYIRKNGTTVQHHQNGIILLNNSNSYEPIGTRIFGPILYEMKKNSKYKTLFLSSSII